MTTEYEVGAKWARKVIASGALREWLPLDLERIISAEFARGFWATVEAVGKALKK